MAGRFDPDTGVTYYPGTSGYERIGQEEQDGGREETRQQAERKETQPAEPKDKKITRSSVEQKIIERENLPADISGGEIISKYATEEERQAIARERRTAEFQRKKRGEEPEEPTDKPTDLTEPKEPKKKKLVDRETPILKEDPKTKQLSVFDPRTGVEAFKGTEQFKRQVREGDLRVETERGMELATETRKEARKELKEKQEEALRKISPALAPEAPFKAEVQRKRAKAALESLTPEEKELIGLRTGGPEARVLKHEHRDAPESFDFKDIKADLTFPRRTTEKLPPTQKAVKPTEKTVISPSGREFERELKESTAQARKERKTMVELGLLPFAGGYGVSLALRESGKRVAAPGFARLFQKVTGVTLATVGGAFAGEVLTKTGAGEFKEAGKELIVGGGFALGAKAAIPREVTPRTITEAVEMSRGRRVKAESVMVEARGTPEPTQMGETKTKIGDAILTRPRFIEVSPIRAESRVSRAGEITERGVGEGFFEGVTEVRIKGAEKIEAIEGKPTVRKGIVREEKVITPEGEVVIGRPEVFGKKTELKGLRGFVRGEKGEALIRGRPEEPFGRGFSRKLPNIESEVKFDPKVRTRLTIFEKTTKARTKPTPITFPLTKEESINKTVTEPLVSPRPKEITAIRTGAKVKISPIVEVGAIKDVTERAATTPETETALGEKRGPITKIDTSFSINMGKIDAPIEKPITPLLPKIKRRRRRQAKKKKGKKKKRGFREIVNIEFEDFKL